MGALFPVETGQTPSLLLRGRGHWRDCCGNRRRRRCRRFGLDTYFVPSEVAAFGSSHFWHGRIGLRVIVVGVPEEKSYAAFLFRCFDLNFYILRRVSLGTPGEGLQPGTNYYATILGDEFEAVHGLADEMLGRV